MTHEMFCPLCRSQLAIGPVVRYQTLDEHVCCPNRSSPERTTLVCTNPKCRASTDGVFWADDGEGPYNTTDVELPPWIDHNPVPFGSYHRGIHFSCGYHAEDREVTCGRLMVRREVTYRSDDYGHKTGKRVRYTIWWNNVLYMSGIGMLHHCLRQFYRHKRDGGTYANEQIKYAIDQADWPRAKWWRKAVRLWIRVFHPTLYKKVTT